jgi:hypothetical protein
MQHQRINCGFERVPAKSAPDTILVANDIDKIPAKDVV